MKNFMTILVVLFSISSMSYALPIERFVDIKLHWSYSEVRYLVERNIVKGVDDQHIMPDQVLKAYEWDTMLSRMINGNETSAYDAQTISREDAIFALYMQVGHSDNLPTAAYRDYMSIGARKQSAVDWATYQGLIKGDTHGRFNPKQLLTRAEAMVIMYRYLTRVSDDIIDEQTVEELTTWLSHHTDYVVAHVKWGPLSTGGHAITINSYRIENRQIILSITKKYPPADSVVTSVISYAEDSIQIPHNAVDEDYGIVIEQQGK